jgi:hypothetical protein
MTAKARLAEALAARGAACWAGVWMPREGGTACGHPAPAVIINIDNTAPAVATCVLDSAIRLPV